ncbi:hypothetical protein IV203_000147 [Nitzschia inconspicua]|uniref:Uncharacterized protein n=1 Tax=Nitzschia inconspicua TaxID=303405 RepID=A0A9K3L613_9STRA|nr:hypothetical protein IV203_000147 [Nitzschia inconspicua]
MSNSWYSSTLFVLHHIAKVLEVCVGIAFVQKERDQELPLMQRKRILEGPWRYGVHYQERKSSTNSGEANNSDITTNNNNNNNNDEEEDTLSKVNCDNTIDNNKTLFSVGSSCDDIATTTTDTVQDRLSQNLLLQEGRPTTIIELNNELLPHVDSVEAANIVIAHDTSNNETTSSDADELATPKDIRAWRCLSSSMEVEKMRV